MEVFNGTENQLHSLMMNHNTIIIYHKSRKSFRIFNNNEKSKWNPILKYCERSLEFTEDRYINRTLKDYLTNPTYLIMYTREELTSWRTMDDIMEDRPSAFI